MGALAQMKMLTFRIYIGNFACLVYKTQITLYILTMILAYFPVHMVSSLTVQKNEIINRPAVLCIFRFPQLLAMSPATFWATFFLASGEIGESPIYMSKKASAHQTRISLVKCERGTSHVLYTRISLSVDSLSALSYVQGGEEFKESKVHKG